MHDGADASLHPERVRGLALVGAPLAALPPERRRVFEVKSERGVMLQHLAALVGPTAHATLWPPRLDWLKQIRE